jgi:hypothetical protein
VKKFAQNVAQDIFVPKLMQFFPWKKSSQKIWSPSEIFKKMPKENNHPIAIIRPIWSPWSKFKFLSSSWN